MKKCLLNYAYWVEFDKNLQKHPLSCVRYSLAPPEPETKEHAVKLVFEQVFMQEIKPLGVVLYAHCYQGDAQNIK